MATSCISCSMYKKTKDMKKTTLATLFAALVISVGCATTVSLPDRLDKFVEKTEKEYKNYTEEDWEKSRAEYDALVAEMKENYDSYTTSEKVRTMQAIGRYSTMVLGSEISNASDAVGDVLQQIPETINGIINDIDTASLRKSVEGIKNGIEGLVESIDTAKIRKSIESISENIDTAKLREKIEAIVKILEGE